jgi:hypothetical protein
MLKNESKSELKYGIDQKDQQADKETRNDYSDRLLLEILLIREYDLGILRSYALEKLFDSLE